MNFLLKSSSVLAFATLSLASNAVSVFIVGQATGATATVGTFAPVVTFNGSDDPFSYITSGSTFNDVPAGTLSTATFTSTSDINPGSFTISFDGTSRQPGNVTSSFSSVATIASATGTFLAYQDLSGLTVDCQTNTASGRQVFDLYGALVPPTNPPATPEPSALAALGLGAVGFVKRRKRA